MNQPSPLARTRPLFTAVALCASALLLLAAALPLAGCSGRKPKERKAPVRYPTLGDKKGVPDFMKGTVWEGVELANDEPYAVSSYGLVGRLRNTGDSTAPGAVRQWMTKEMVKRGYGSQLNPNFRGVGPGDVLASPTHAIVEVHALIPPGARKGDWIDAYVRCLPRNRTTSLSHGVLFETELKERGVDPTNPNSTIAILARAKGPIVVNPVYALGGLDAEQTTAAKASLRSGTVMFSAKVEQDRPLTLQIRNPQRSVSRAIELRVNEYFQGMLDRKKGNGQPGQAEAVDEGRVELFVPARFRGDWEHFAGVATHLYLNTSAAFAAIKAKELVAEAQKPDAPLQDISYCWEGLGGPAMPFLTPLFSHADPNVAYAAARAAAFIGDPSGAAQATLVRMARTKDHPFQIASIQTLGALPSSTAVNHMLRGLLDGEQTLVRIEAYKVLARNRDNAVFTRWIEDPTGSRADGTAEHKFALDIVKSNGPPIVYASRSGAPRIAVIGRTPALPRPVTFTAIDTRFSISSRPGEPHVTLFYRDELFMRNPMKVASNPDVAEIVARLGGEGPIGERRFNFTYGEILAILQALSDQKKMLAVATLSPQPKATGTTRPAAQPTPAPPVYATLVLQDPPRVQEELMGAPVIGDPRPQADAGAGPDDPSLTIPDALLSNEPTAADLAPEIPAADPAVRNAPIIPDGGPSPGTAPPAPAVSGVHGDSRGARPQ